LSYAGDDYAGAHQLLQRAQNALAQMHPPAQLSPADAQLMSNAGRLLQLMPNPMRPRERVARILIDRDIARKRFDSCSTQLLQGSSPAVWQSLAQRWAGPDATAKPSILMRDPERQDTVLRLVYDTEILAQKLCRAPSSDDVLLLKLASSSYGITQPETEPARSNEKPAQPR
jgi:hypothetical protein